MQAYVTVLDEDAELVPYFVRHYSRLGATLFPVLVYSDADGELERVCNLVEEAGGVPEPLGAFPSSYFSAKRRDRYIRDNHPTGSWGFFADLDEFCELTPEEVQRLIKAAPPYVAGRWVDRVAPGGKLADVDPTRPLEEQYPLGCRTRVQLKAADYVYVMSPRGPNLHHPNACRWGRKHHPLKPLVRVHHFKWSTNVVRRLTRRLQRIDEQTGTPNRMRWRARVERTLRYLRNHGGGVDPDQLVALEPVLGI